MEYTVPGMKMVEWAGYDHYVHPGHAFNSHFANLLLNFVCGRRQDKAQAAYLR